MKRFTFLVLSILIFATIFLMSCQPPEVTSAKVYMNEDNYDKAQEQAELAVEKYPNNATAHYILGKVYAKKKEFVKMLNAFNKSLKISDMHKQDINKIKEINWVTIFNAGIDKYRNNDMEGAVSNFKLAIRFKPDDINAYKNLALAYSNLDSIEKSINTLKKAVEIDPENIDVKKTLGIAYYQAKQFENAIETFNQVAEKTKPDTSLTDTYALAIQHIAFSYDQLGESEKAIDAYSEALKVFPDNEDLIYNLGRLHYLQENYEKAIENFKKVADANPNDFDATYNTAMSYLRAKKNEEAIPYFKKATELNPESYDAWNNLGVVYVRANMPEKGKEAFAKADELKAIEGQE